MNYNILGCDDTMRDFIQELKSIKILSYNDIHRLRTYIQSKYPHSNTKQHADILIDSIRKIIDGYLKAIPRDEQLEIRELLLKDTLVLKNENILLYDIFHVMTTQYQEKENYLSVLLEWMNQYLDNPIHPDDLRMHLHSPMNNFIPILDTPREIQLPSKQNSLKVILSGMTVLLVLLFSINHLHGKHTSAPMESEIPMETSMVENAPPHLPEYFLYKEIDTHKLRGYLKSRNSLLEEEPYFSSIINVAREFDLNPLILFAVAGQEQGFVSKSNALAHEIVNNPFNVFVSWKDYNTDIMDSSRIAARTILNLSKDRPQDIDPFQWINRKYAEDEHWWKGVKSIFHRLERAVQDFSSEEI